MRHGGDWLLSSARDVKPWNIPEIYQTANNKESLLSLHDQGKLADAVKIKNKHRM